LLSVIVSFVSTMPNRRLALALALLVAGVLTTACSGSRSTTDGPDGASGTAPVVVARYADTSITLDDFERRYARSVGGRDSAARDSLQAYQDFLDRYLEFRLKVRAAREAGLDTLASVRHDIRSYREQMARPRLVREEIMRPIARTLYERRATEVDVSHILLRVGPNAAPADTQNAYRKLQMIRDSLERGADFGAMAQRYSEDPSAQQEGRRGYRGRLGYLTAGDIVEPFEDRMYGTPVDSISEVFRTRFGYHVLKVHDRRARPQPRRISHILIRTGRRAARDSAEARRLADSLKTAARRGADFAELARTYSEDRGSASKGGDLGMVRPSGRLPDAFREAVVSLDSVGAVSDVVQTQYGFHVLTMTDREKRGSFEEEYDALREEAAQMERVKTRKNRLAALLRKDFGASVDTAAVAAAAGVPSADSAAAALVDADLGAAAGRTFASLGDSTYAIRALVRYVASVPGARQMPLRRAVRDFVDDRTIRYATARLAQRDPDFSRTLTEYREGVLLFRYMQDSVWTAASRDTAGLRQTYRAHPDRYRFPERVRTIVLRSSADSLLQPYVSAHADGTALDAIVNRAATDSLVEADTVMVTDSTSAPFRQMRSVSDGAAAGPVRSDGSPLFMIRDRRLPPRPKSFAEARSEVVRDHQDTYEEQVVERLRRRYGAEAYPGRLTAAFSSGAAPARRPASR
jgi:peptidyl-prolyl cis-trans isomerase SurA